MKIAIGSDHGGFELKEKIKSFLLEQKHEVKDFGTNSMESCDYPDFAYPAAKAVAAKEFDFGVLFCGSGVGVTIVANKVPGIRAVNAQSVEIARQSREHGNCNVLALGGRYVDLENAKKIVAAFLATPFTDDPRHKRRIGKIEK
ncbi:ribose 5-phosphate isomerase B [Candidatus Saganbacteria bacterium]|nr:ribose 5-phosphate isomerase B [Candidatus Saganbacteria bacterium]